MPPRRSITLLSAIVHAAILATVVLAQLFSIGPLPTPRSVLAFSDVTPVHIKDIVLPDRRHHASLVEQSTNVAPIVPPGQISPEPDRSGEPAARGADDVPGPDAGLPGGIDLPGRSLRLEAAPPPPPPLPPRGPIRLHSGMQAPQKIVNVPPRYPAIAQTARVEGLVVLEATIDTAGRVNDVRIVRSIPLLDQAAIDAVRQWRFTPTLLNGEPVSILLTVSVRFTLQ